MGGEQFRKRKYLSLYIAGIFGIQIAISGCAHFAKELQQDNSLKRAWNAMDQGDFNLALIENAKALDRPLSLSKDRSLFQRGVIYSHPKNPDLNYKRSIDLFKEISDRFPDSELIHPVETFISLLNQLSDREVKIKSFIRKLDKIEYELKKNKRIMNQQRKALKNREVKIERLNMEVKELKAQLEKIKIIDLDIQKMKEKSIYDEYKLRK